MNVSIFLYIILVQGSIRMLEDPVLPSPINQDKENPNNQSNNLSNNLSQNNNYVLNDGGFESITLKTEEVERNAENAELQKTQEFNSADTPDNASNNMKRGTLLLNSNAAFRALSGNKISFIKKASDISLNEFLGPPHRESRLNLSISRISLKNNFNDTTSSKLRATYKKGNENSILNITNVNAKENQFIKFFTNNSLYDKDKVTAINLNNTMLKEKIVSTAQTSKKLASDVISIYREKVSEKLKTSDEKAEAKEIISKQINNYKPFTEDIAKRDIIYETDVERIMRMPVHKYANSVFPGAANNMTFHHQSVIGINMAKLNVTAIEKTSRLLSPTKKLKPKVKEEILRESLYTFQPMINKSNVPSKIDSHQTSFSSSIINGKKNMKEGKQKNRQDDDAKLKSKENIFDECVKNKMRTIDEGLIINKFKDLVEKANWN